MYQGCGEYFPGELAPDARPLRYPLGEYFQATPPALEAFGQSVLLNDAVLPRYHAVGAEGDQYRTMTVGHVALAGAGGIIVGLTMMWLWKGRRKRSAA